MAEKVRRFFVTPEEAERRYGLRWEVVTVNPRYTRAHGEQPEPQHSSPIGACPFCARVPCEDQVHALWRAGRNGSDV